MVKRRKKPKKRKIYPSQIRSRRGRPRKRGRPKKTKLEKAEEPTKKIKIRLIGIGGGGGSIVSEIAQKVKGASFYAANSDVKALNALSKKVKKFQFGKNLTHGLGTGMNPDIGEEAARVEKDRIKEILEGQDFIILISCLGGGLGSGAAPIFAKLSKRLNNLTYGIFTLPFNFEGGKKMETARKSLGKLSTELNAYSIIPNERIFQIIDKSAPLKKALSAINKNLSNSLQSLIQIIYKPGIINIDFADLKTIFEGRGKLAYLNSMELSKDDDKDALDKIINYPLYPYSIEGAKGVLFNISGRKDLSLLQVHQISETISNLVNKEAKIIFGITRDNQNPRIKISLLATGCNGRGVLRTTEPKLKIKPKTKPKAKPKTKLKTKSKPKTPIKSGKKKTKKRKKTKSQKIKIKIKEVSSSKPVKASFVLDQSMEPKSVKIRKNALQIKKEMEQEEAAIVSKEKLWEAPAFLRRKASQD